MIRLPVPFEYGGALIKDCEIKPYTAGVLADTQKAAEGGDAFKPMSVFVSGCIEKLGDITDKNQVKSAVLAMPFKSAEYLTTRIALQSSDDDGIEGVFSCPRCGTSIVCEETADADTRDHFSDLKVEYSEGVPAYTLDLAKPITVPALESEGEISSVSSLTFDFPSVAQCITAYALAGDRDRVRLQLAIYREALAGVNGSVIDKKWKTRYSMIVFERLEHTALRDLGKNLNYFGVNQNVTKTCNKCGKVYEAPVNTAGFFANALR